LYCVLGLLDLRDAIIIQKWEEDDTSNSKTHPHLTWCTSGFDAHLAAGKKTQGMVTPMKSSKAE
jgi:hypothetical protein